MIIIILIINFLNFIIEAFSAETELSFLPVIAIVGALFGLDYFNILPLKSLIGDGLLYIANNPVFILIPLAVLAVFYAYNFKILSTSNTYVQSLFLW